MSAEAPAHYLVIDLEATCDEQHRLPRDETEIIELGAVLLEARGLTQVASFQRFVRPVLHPQLTPFCTRLTSITQADVAEAPRLPEVLVELTAFLDGRDALFCSWGDYDRAQLEREARRHGLALPFGGRHFNIKEAFARQADDGKLRGVGQALDRVGRSFEGTKHRGIDDARNIARLLPFALGREPLPAPKSATRRP